MSAIPRDPTSRRSTSTRWLVDTVQRKNPGDDRHVNQVCQSRQPLDRRRAGQVLRRQGARAPIDRAQLVDASGQADVAEDRRRLFTEDHREVAGATSARSRPFVVPSAVIASAPTPAGPSRSRRLSPTHRERRRSASPASASRWIDDAHRRHRRRPSEAVSHRSARRAGVRRPRIATASEPVASMRSATSATVSASWQVESGFCPTIVCRNVRCGSRAPRRRGIRRHPPLGRDVLSRMRVLQHASLKSSAGNA